jgi:integrase
VVETLRIRKPKRSLTGLAQPEVSQVPKLSQRVPALRHHKSDDRAVVTLGGKDVYLGRYGTKESRDSYERLIGEYLANGRTLPASVAPAPAGPTVAELILAYWRNAKVYYASPHSGELRSIKLALGKLRRLYGSCPVAAFGPLALKAVRDAMVKAGWSRKYVNGQVGRLKRCFRWGVGQEMVPPSIWHGLQAVDGLRLGRTMARETQPVKPVREELVEATLPLVSAQVAAMIRLQLLTGARAGEIILLRGQDLDTSIASLWVYCPEKHKTLHHGHDRHIYVGPRAQEILRPFLKPDEPGAYVFASSEAERARHTERSEKRVTPVQPSQVERRKAARRHRRARPPGDRYEVASYRRAIARACDAAFPPPAPFGRREKESARQWKARLTEKERGALMAWRRQHRWHPHQLRHNAATRLRKEFGLEAAQVILGHRTLAVTEIYAEKNIAAAQEIMAKGG